MIEKESLASQRIEIAGSNGMVLKQWLPEEAPVIKALMDFDPEHLNRNHQHIAESFQTAEELQAHLERLRGTRMLFFGLWPNNEKMVGAMYLLLDDERAEPVTASTGVWVGKEHIGHGYSAQSLRVLMPYAFQNMGIERVVADVVSTNLYSTRILRKAGFKLSSVSKRQDEKTGDWFTEMRYELLKDKYQIEKNVQ